MNRERSNYLRWFYGSLSAQFDRIMDLFYRGRDRIWRERALQELPENARILETGAGTGRTEAIGSPAEEHVSLDISRSMLSASTSMSNPIEGDVHALPFPDDSFDAAVSVLLMSTKINHQRALDEMRRVVRDDGRIVLVDKFGGSRRRQRLLDRLKNLLTYPLAFDFDVDVEEIASNVGLSVVKREPMPQNMNMIELVVLE